MAFADYVALVFHEARNVRHLVKKGKLDGARYRLLIDGLSENRAVAWKQIQHLRKRATLAQRARDAEAIFSRAYGLTLEDLSVLSAHEGWKGSQKGGNKWAAIDRAVVELRAAIDLGDASCADRLLQELPLMCHNTGCLGEKLKLLDAISTKRDHLQNRQG
jgi:hypothetical protein